MSDCCAELTRADCGEVSRARGFGGCSGAGSGGASGGVSGRTAGTAKRGFGFAAIEAPPKILFSQPTDPYSIPNRKGILKVYLSVIVLYLIKIFNYNEFKIKMQK